MRALQVWYAAHPDREIIARVEEARAGAGAAPAEHRRGGDAGATTCAPSGKLSITTPGGSWLLRDRPPLLQRLAGRRPGPGGHPGAVRGPTFGRWQPDRRVLVEKHRLLDVALKVVGVGSVGTRCYIALFAGPAGGPLILQVKEARESVLEPHVRHGGHRHQGERVVSGQRIMQAVSDIFLGWTKSPVTGTEYYVRQLHDMKYSVDIAGLRAAGHGGSTPRSVPGRSPVPTPARATRPTIAGYLGAGEVFDEALAAFAVAYADQTERDHAAFVAAIGSGRVAAEAGV